MAIKLTYTDGQESQYGDDTAWEVDDGVLKLGKEKGKWSVLLSPSHWAVIEVGGGTSSGGDSKDSKDDDKDSKDDDDSDDSTDEPKVHTDTKDDDSKDDSKDDDSEDKDGD